MAPRRDRFAADPVRRRWDRWVPQISRAALESTKSRPSVPPERCRLMRRQCREGLRPGRFGLATRSPAPQHFGQFAGRFGIHGQTIPPTTKPGLGRQRQGWRWLLNARVAPSHRLTTGTDCNPYACRWTRLPDRSFLKPQAAKRPPKRDAPVAAWSIVSRPTDQPRRPVAVRHFWG